MTIITDEVKKIMDEDISRIASMINIGPNDAYDPTFFELYVRIKSKYNSFIQGFGDGMISNKDARAYKRNLITLKEKLELFKAMGYKNYEWTDNSSNFQIVNNNSNNLSMSVSFEQAKNSIENMTALSSIEKEEIISKIEQIEKIVLSNENKSKKWEKLNEIIKWIADKGVEVGIGLLPLLLKIE